MGKERVLSGQSPKTLRNNPSSCETFFFFFLSKWDRRNSVRFGEHFYACSFRFLNKNVHIHR